METVEPVEDTSSTKRERLVRFTGTPSSPELLSTAPARKPRQGVLQYIKKERMGQAPTQGHSSGIPGRILWEPAHQTHFHLIPATP